MTDRRAQIVLAALLAAGCGRLSGGGGASTPTSSPPAPALAALVSESRLESLVLDADSALLTWSALESTDAALALFVGDDAATLYDGATTLAPLEGGRVVVVGLDEGGAYAFGLARAVDGGGWQPVGDVLTGRALAPIYVDAAAPSVGADGLTPASAYPNPLLAMLDAFVAGEGNIWFAGGDYAALSVPPFAEVSLSGGFDGSFAFEQRDPALHPTRVHGAAGKPVVDLEGDGEPLVLDGLELLGDGLANVGLDAGSTPLELRGVRVSAAVGAGLRLTAPENGLPLPVRLVDCVLDANGAEGLSARGAFDVSLRGSSFLSNHQEGADFDDLVAADGGSASLFVRDCLFASNGTDGLDCDVAQPAGGGFFGGVHRVRVDNSRFERNGAVGLLLDVDYPAGSGWSGDAVLRGVLARGNALDGLQLDLDAEFDLLVLRTRASANGRDGARLTSDVLATQATFCASAFVGNLGAGLSALEGQAAPLLSHVYLAGNAEAGVRAEFTQPALASALAWLQPAAWDGARVVASVESDDLLAPPLAAQALGFLRVAGVDDDTLTFAPGQELPTLADFTHELADDGVARQFLAQPTAATLALEPAPSALLTPASLQLWPLGEQVDEDHTPSPASPLLGVGLAAPGAPPVDAGVLGAPLGGTPGEDLERAPLFWLASVEPSPAAGLAPGDTLVLRFTGGTPDAATVNGTQLVARASGGGALTLALQVVGDSVEVDALGGWPVGAVDLELHAGLAALDGTSLAAPLVLPLDVSP